MIAGDAKGTKIIQNFSDDPSGVLVNTKVSLELSGILIPVSFIPEQNFIHALDTIILSFYDYTITEIQHKNELEN